MSNLGVEGHTEGISWKLFSNNVCQTVLTIIDSQWFNCNFLETFAFINAHSHDCILTPTPTECAFRNKLREEKALGYLKRGQ